MMIMNYTSQNDRDFYIHTMNFLKDLKIYNGGKGVQAFLRRHKDIDKYLFTHFKANASQMDSEVKNYLHK